MSDGKIKIDIEIDGRPIEKIEADFKRMESTAKKSASGTDDVGKSLNSIDGKKVNDASLDLKGLGDSTKKSAKDVDDIKDSIDGVDGKSFTETKEKVNEFGKETQKGERSLKDFVVALGLVKVASIAFNVLASSMDAAISRFDTIEKFPKVLESMGFEAEQSERAMTRMSNSIDGLPTTLDEMVGLTQKFVNITGDLDKSVDTAEALNNAMLASGASSADAARGVEQYSQMLANGEPDMQSWRSVNDTMGYGLKRTAEEMLGAGNGAMELYDSLKSGEVTMDEVNEKLIELGGSTGELGILAKENSKGIATSFSNLKNAAVKGLANVMKSLDEVSQAVTGNTIAENLDGMKVVVNKTFDSVNKTIIASTPIIKGAGIAFEFVTDSADALSPVLVALTVAFVGLKVVDTVTKALNTSKAAMTTAEVATKGLEGITIKLTQAKAIEVAAIKTSDGATKAEIATQLASNGVITAKTALIAILSGEIGIVTAAKWLWTTATTALNGALMLLIANPVVAAVAAITGAIAVGIKMSNSWNAELFETTKEMRNMTGTVKENSKTTEDNIRKRDTTIKKLGEETDAAKSMADRLDQLTASEKASGESKKEIEETVTELNRLYPDLNLKYDENTNKVNQNANAIKAQVEAAASYDKVVAIQDNLKQSTTELSEAEAEQARIADDLKTVREKKSETDWYSIRVMGDLKKTERELIEQEEANASRRHNLVSEQQILIEQQEIARQEALEAQKAAVREAGFQYDFLSDKQKEMVDTMKGNYQDLVASASSFTSDLSFELEMTGQEFINFVANNQQVMTDWANNMKILSERGVNEGFLTQLQNMGPEGAQYAQLAVNMSADELAQLNSVFSNAEPVAQETWSKVYGMENADQALKDQVFKMPETFKQSFAESGITELLQEQGKQNVQAIADGIEDNTEVLDQAIENVTNSVSANSEKFKSKFMESGRFIPEGLASGISENKDKPISAMDNVTLDIINGTNSAFEIKSPSRKFAQIGEFIIQGLANGVTETKDLAIKAMTQLNQELMRKGDEIKQTFRKLSIDIPMQFSGLPSDMNNIGINAMIGLENGIYAGQNGPLNAAQNIANNIKSTIQSALDIHSPSRWMRNKIGKFIPQGIALGIDDDADTIVRSMNNLNNLITSGVDTRLLTGNYSHVVTSNMTGNGTSANQNKASSTIINVLSEQNQLLKQLVNKNTQIALDGNIITEMVNRNNAINDSLSYFGG